MLTSLDGRWVARLSEEKRDRAEDDMDMYLQCGLDTIAEQAPAKCWGKSYRCTFGQALPLAMDSGKAQGVPGEEP